jgi:hypothetical protein
MVNRLKVLGAAAALAIASGCANYASLQDADVMEKDTGSFGIGASFTSYNFTWSVNDSISDTSSISTPAVNFWYRKGITDRLEAHANVWIPLGVTFGLKYQLLGAPKRNGFGLSLGLDAGYLQMGSDSSKVTIVDVYVPLYTGYKFSESFALYVVPKYIPRFVLGDESKIVNIIAGTGGIRIGNKTRFMIEGTYGYDATYKLPIVNTAAGISF